MAEYLAPVAVISVLILLNAFFVAAEFAIVAAPRTRVAQAAEQGSRPAAGVLAVLNSSQRQNLYLATAQLGITVASLGLGMYGEHAVADWLMKLLANVPWLAQWSDALAHTLATVLAIGLLTYFHVVVGEMVPKSLALQHAEATALRLNNPMSVLQRLLRPIIGVLNAIANGVVHLLGIRPAGAQARLLTAQELELIVEESTERGMVEPAEQLFIENIFDLRQRTVSQVMTPRNHIVGISLAAQEADILRLVCEERYSRYPVYDGTLDKIVGVLHIKDLARDQTRRQAGQPFSLDHLRRSILYVPESISLEQMLIRFRREHSQIAVVLDEFGGTAGLVTLEDIVEEVVGEILDEFDQELPPLERIGPGMFRARGDLLVDELNQTCDLALAHPEADTVGGLLMSLLGRVAHPGDRVEHDGVSFVVEEVEGLAVLTVIVHVPPSPAG